MRSPTRHPRADWRQIRIRTAVKGARTVARKHHFPRIVLAVVSAVLAGTAAAQTSGLEEIMVTAQKREQSLQDVGIAVTAFSDKQIRELGFTDSTDIVAMTPGLVYTTPNAESSVINFFLRGVGLNDFADANENPVAVYVDEVYRPASGGLSFQLFDLERVEVLKGPQGTLFGRNTTGGLVHFISKRPTDELDGYVDLQYGSYDQIKAEGAIGGPLGDTFSARLSAAMDKYDGWTENRFAGTPDYNEGDSRAARLQLQWEPSDALSFLLSGNYSDNDATVGAWQHQATTFNENGESVPLGPDEQSFAVDCNTLTPEPDGRPFPGTDCFGYRDTDGDPWAGDYDRDGRVETEASGGSLKIDWDVGDVTVTSITAYQKVERLQEEDTEASPAPLVMPTFAAETKTFTQELRAAGGSDTFRWLVGGFYFDNDVDGHYLLDLTNIEFVFFNANYTQTSESLAAFAQVELDLSDQFTVIAGGRWSNDQKELDYLNVDESGVFEFLTGSPVAFDFDKNSQGDLAEHDDDSWSGKLELDFKPNDDLLLYGSVSRGTKPAGFNVGFLDQNGIFATNTAETIPFGEETLTSYEVGFKSTLGDGRTRFNAAAFYYDYEDFQTFRFELLNQVIFNADAEVTGGELELQTSPADGWDIGLGLAILDAKAKDIPVPFSDPQVLREREMVAAPDVAANAMIRYEWPMLGGRTAIQGTVTYQDDIYYDIQNVPVSFEDGYAVANLRLSYASDSSPWEIAAFVDNITEEEYLVYTFDFTGTFGFNQQAYGKPLWAGISFRYNFE
jgi:iron complex outermembrane receptor protein